MINPFDVLVLPPTATPAQVKAQWKALASLHHPDHGGDMAMFNMVRQAYKDALKKASEPKKCMECGGTGKVSEVCGFSSTSVRCKVCNGRGRVGYED